MTSIFRSPFKTESLKWKDIYTKVKIYYPATWERIPYDEKIANVGFQAKKMVGENTALFMMVAAHSFENPYDKERINEIVQPYSIKEEMQNIGEYVCSAKIDISEASGFWVIHKTKQNDMLGYRVTYNLYGWKYRFMLLYGTVSTDITDALSLYKENDPFFYDMASKTKINWK